MARMARTPIAATAVIACVLGTAECLADDLLICTQLPTMPMIIATNEAASVFADPDHIVTCHPEMLKRWRDGRDIDTWSPRPVKDRWKRSGRPYEEPGHIVPAWSNGGSGLFAVTVALDHLGVDEVILAGCPMDPTPHYHDHPMWHKDPWADAELYRGAWVENYDKMHGKVTSCSGWTQEMLGAP